MDLSVNLKLPASIVNEHCNTALDYDKEYTQEDRDEADERGMYYPDKDEYFDDNYREDLEADFILTHVNFY